MANDIQSDGEFYPQSLPRPAEPDAHGQAALLLTESILHALVEAGVLTATQALSAVQTAAEVKADVATETGESEGRMLQSLGLLTAISQGFDERR